MTRAAGAQPRLGGHVVDARPDTSDFRDWHYRPALIPLAAEIDPRRMDWWDPGRVRDQRLEPSCTGHALATVIDHLLAKVADDRLRPVRPPQRSQLREPWASARMLYENAKFHDEWEGESYRGSSLRGVLKGFYNNGVCSTRIQAKLEFEIQRMSAEIGDPKLTWFTNPLLTEDAVKIQLGAYYRVRSRLADMHAALNEAGVLLVSANIHEGWTRALDGSTIRFDNNTGGATGHHAFVVLGYDEDAFWIQNSWGTGWGDEGLARWRYADWAHNIYDVWVLRLAVPVEEASKYSVGVHGMRSSPLRRSDGLNADDLDASTRPTRIDVLGHLVPIEDGRLKARGRYHHDLPTLLETFRIIERRRIDVTSKTERTLASSRTVADSNTFRYRHVLIQFLGAGRNEGEAARVAKALQERYTANGIYPIFLLWEVELFRQLYELVSNAIEEVNLKSDTSSDRRDHLKAKSIESRLATISRRLKSYVELAASSLFFTLEPTDDPDVWQRKSGQGVEIFSRLFATLHARFRDGGLSYHFAAHGFNAWALLEFLRSHHEIRPKPVISSLNLISPSVDLATFKSQIGPLMIAAADGPVSRRARLREPLIENVNLWHLSEEADISDRFADGYPRSWPALWSRVFGLIEEADREAEDGADVGAPEPDTLCEANERVPVSRRLNMAKYAVEAGSFAAAEGLPLTIRCLSLGRERWAPPRHFGLDADEQVVSEMLELMLASEAGIGRPTGTGTDRIVVDHPRRLTP